jgi:peptidoglycan/LPS O-acetylase OafA/YrhL
VLVASGLLVGIIDLLRPASQQTHVGRFFDRVTRDGFGGFALVIRRKATENIEALTSTRLVWLLPIGVVFLAYLWCSRATHVRKLVRDTPVIGQTLIAFALTAVLGFALNDSGIAIPALMMLVLECAAAFVVAARLDEPWIDAAVPPSAGEPAYARSADRG